MTSDTFIQTLDAAPVQRKSGCTAGEGKARSWHLLGSRSFNM